MLLKLSLISSEAGESTELMNFVLFELRVLYKSSGTACLLNTGNVVSQFDYSIHVCDLRVIWTSVEEYKRLGVYRKSSEVNLEPGGKSVHCPSLADSKVKGVANFLKCQNVIIVSQ